MYQQPGAYYSAGGGGGGGGGMDAAQYYSHSASMASSSPPGSQMGTVPAVGEYMLHNWAGMDGTDLSVSCVHFDKYEDLLWSVNRGGHLTGYYGSHLSKYVSVHAQKDLRQVCATPQADIGVFAIAKNCVQLYSKFGQRRWAYSCPGMTNDLTAALYEANNYRLTVGGRQDRVLQLDCNSGSVLKCIDLGSEGCEFLRASARYICAGSSRGQVTLIDPVTRRKEHTFGTVTGQLSDMAVQENLLVTCGWSMRQDGTLLADRLLQAFDLRVMRPVQPFCVQLDPQFVRFMPALHDRLLVANSVGEFQFLQLGQSMPASPVYHLGVAVSDIDISSSSRCIAVGDTGGGVYLLTADTDMMTIRFNMSPMPTAFPDDPVYSPNPISLSNESFFFTNIPFGYAKESDTGGGSLSSDWQPRMCRSYERRLKPIDDELLSSASHTRGLSIARKPSSWGRTHFPYYTQSEVAELTRQTLANCQPIQPQLLTPAEVLAEAAAVTDAANAAAVDAAANADKGVAANADESAAAADAAPVAASVAAKEAQQSAGDAQGDSEETNKTMDEEKASKDESRIA